MSHVVSSQPSSTSPYQPTEVQENPPRIKSTIETRQDRDDCCFRADKSQGCFMYYCCNFLSSVCGGIRDCTENCCNYCADCLNDCCEDKPEDKNKRRRYKNRANSAGLTYDDYDDNTWVVGAIQHHNTVGSDDQAELRPITHDISVKHSSNHHSGNHNSHCHDNGERHDSHGHHGSSGHHDTGGHHDSSGGHHDSGGNHDSGGGGGTCDSGGGGDSGGGCDSGGGGDTGCTD